MGEFAAIYLEVKPGREQQALERLRFAMRGRPGTYHLRYRAGTGWVQLCPGSAHFEGDDLEAMLGNSPLVEQPLTALAGSISSELAATVLSLEAQTTVEFALYSRWERGQLRRLIEYCGEYDAGVVRSVGQMEPWELELVDEFYTAHNIGEALSLPGFGADAWATNATYWTCEVEVTG